jgi:ABC-2 type transport system permease protein
MKKPNLKMNINIIEIFKNKRVRYGGYAALITLSAAVVLVVLNLIIQQVPSDIDMTDNKLFTLSEQTKDLIDQLEEPVTIYGLYPPGQESENVVDVVRKYERASRKISYEQIDPDKNPAFLQKYDTEDTGLSAGSLIVESGDNFKIISGIDLYDVSYNQSGQAQVMGFKAEQRLTNALLFASSGVTPKVYQIIGHGEYTFVQLGLQATIEKENFEVAELNLLTTKEIPADADLITLLSPEFDLTEGEVEVLRTYLENDGSAMICTDIAAGELPVLNTLLASFGVNIDFSIVMEGDKARLYDPDNPFFLAPVIQTHQITDPLIEGGLTVLMPYNMPVVELDIVKRNVDIVPLLQSTDKSWIRTELDNTSLLQQAADRSGPASVAVAINKRKMEMSEPEGFRLIVAGNAGFVGPIPPFGTLKPNVDFLMNSLAWLNKRDDSISVRSKSLFTFPLRISGQMQLVYAAIFVILLPLGILIAGLVVWLRRRHL